VYTRIRIEAAPKRRRRAVPRFEKTEEWSLMRIDLEKKLAPGEALQVLLTENDKKKYGIRTRISVVRFIKKYLAGQKLPYKVRSFRRDEGDYVIVQQNRSR
jgi:hypothetical protein